MHTPRHRQHLFLTIATLLACQAASAASPPSSKSGQSDLLLVIWDSVAQVSYTQALLPTATSADKFWINAQQDAGYSFSLELDATNAALTEFRKVSTSVTNQSWAVFGFQSGLSLDAGVKIYSTLAQGPGDGVVNPNWTDMTTSGYGVIRAAFDVSKPAGLYGGLSSSPANGLSVRPNSPLFSSFDRKGSSGYFAGQTGFSSRGGNADGSFLAGTYNVTNAVGKSSWFYYLTNAEDAYSVTVDEFDNLSFNGYWGLALTNTDKYLLSYTLPAYVSPKTSAVSEVGAGRVSFTDYAADAGVARLLNFSDAVSAVPEPSTWALFALGLLGLLTGVGRRR